MTVLVWVGIMIAILMFIVATAIGGAIGGLRAMADSFHLILNGDKEEMETAIWVVTCPETDRLSTVEVSYRPGSPVRQVTDCFNRATRERCRQQCLRASRLDARTGAVRGLTPLKKCGEARSGRAIWRTGDASFRLNYPY